MILIRHPGATQAVPGPGVVLRPPVVADAVELGQLYFDAYEPGVAAATEQDALDDITLSFDGGYGVLDQTLSRLAWAGEAAGRRTPGRRARPLARHPRLPIHH